MIKVTNSKAVEKIIETNIRKIAKIYCLFFKPAKKTRIDTGSKAKEKY